jgi:hypothetical protein
MKEDVEPAQTEVAMRHRQIVLRRECGDADGEEGRHHKRDEQCMEAERRAAVHSVACVDHRSTSRLAKPIAIPSDRSSTIANLAPSDQFIIWCMNSS